MRTSVMIPNTAPMRVSQRPNWNSSEGRGMGGSGASAANGGGGGMAGAGGIVEGCGRSGGREGRE